MLDCAGIGSTVKVAVLEVVLDLVEVVVMVEADCVEVMVTRLGSVVVVLSVITDAVGSVKVDVDAMVVVVRAVV